MKATFLTIAIAVIATACPAQEFVKAGQAFSETSVNTTSFRCNAIVTHGGKQYISYYDPEGYVVVGRRKTGAKNWYTRRTQYKGKVKDAHNSISIAVDGDGYIHLSFDHHDNELRYCRSLLPDSLSFGPKQSMTGLEEEKVTYPQFFLLADGGLLFAYRSGASGKGNLVLNRYDLTTRTWKRLHDALIDGEGKRNAYWQMCIDPKGTLHLSWVWRETWHVETNHDLCYAYSKDGGLTWQKTSGSKYSLPIRLDNAEYACRIPQNSELINQTGMCADAQGHPYIATYWREPDSDIPQYRIVWHDGWNWRQQQVSDRKEAFSLSGGGTKKIPIGRPCLAVDGKEVFYFFRDEERGNKASMFHTKNLTSGRWKATDLTTFSVDAWEPVLDTELWNKSRELNLFLQASHQGDGERMVKAAPEPAGVLEVKR